MNKEIFSELEEKGEFINAGYGNDLYFFILRKDKYLEVKRKFCDPDYTGY